MRAFTTGATRRTAVRGPVAFRYAQSFATRAEASVEEDLDAALEDILGGDSGIAIADKEESNGVNTVTHIEGSHPIPKALVEKVSQSDE